MVPIKDKTGKTLVIAFKSVLKSVRCPKSLQTDKGTEFKNKEFQNFLKTKKIHFFTTENPETKASIVERFQRTLKTRMWKYFTHHCTLRYVDILPKLVHGYNHAYHRSIKCAPVSVTLKNEPQVSENLYGKSNSKKVKPKFKVNDFVRINKTKRTFDKGYLPNWTQELFQILAVVKTQTPITYKIKDLEGELVKGTFYSHELQRVEKDQIYEIDFVLDHRKRKVGKKWVKQIKVHWKGYPSKFDSWILESGSYKSMKMDLRGSFVRGDTASVQSAEGRDRTVKNRFTFFAQIIVVYMIIVTSLVQISLRSPDKELWLILLSSSIGYILPSPGLKFRKQTNPISADETDSPKLKP